MSEIDLFKELLKVKIQQAEDEKRKNTKMYRSLGTIIGLTIIIILF